MPKLKEINYDGHCLFEECPFYNCCEVVDGWCTMDIYYGLNKGEDGDAD